MVLLLMMVKNCFLYRHARTDENVECSKKLVAQIQKVIFNEDIQDSKIENEYITPNTNELTIRQYLQLETTVSTFDAKDKAVIWTASDTKIAQINQNGFVTAVSKGRVFIIPTSADGKHVTS